MKSADVTRSRPATGRVNGTVLGWCNQRNQLEASRCNDTSQRGLFKVDTDGLLDDAGVVLQTSAARGPRGNRPLVPLSDRHDSSDLSYEEKDYSLQRALFVDIPSTSHYSTRERVSPHKSRPESRGSTWMMDSIIQSWQFNGGAKARTR